MWGSSEKLFFDNIGQFIYKKDIVELSKHIPDDLVRKISGYLDVL